MKKNKKTLEFNYEKEQDRESVLSLSDDEDLIDNYDDSDENFTDDDEFGNIHEIKAKKLEMDSDFEEDEDENIPNAKSWGKKAQKYFGTDYVDKDGAGITEKDRRIAEAEEEEGLEAQQRLLNELNESAIDFDCFEPVKDEADFDETTEIVNLDLLNESEKKQFLKKQSPEFFIFKEDFENYSKESKNKLLKFIKFCDDDRYKHFKENDLYKFLVAKNSLITRYCMNIAFYMYLKTKNFNIKNHPIRSTLNSYRKLSKQTDEYLNSIGLIDIDLLISKLKETSNEDDLVNIKYEDKVNLKRKKIEKKSKSKKVKFADETNDKLIDSLINEEKADVNNDNLDNDNETKDEEYYSDEYQDEKEVLFVHKRDDVKKRKISKMIEKNKGLRSYRKRDYRNPRVRYKSKYKKAEIKRKSQVKEPVKEIKKYSGEYHGIKSSVVRSVKFK